MVEAVSTRALRATSRKLIPLILLLYFINYIDRINIGFAALTMNTSLGLTASMFGLGASIFFIGYVVLEVPSNLILAKVGARRWIARILISWGIVSAGTSLVVGPTSFYFARLLLGIAEAGFFPGIIFYLTLWFPAAHRAKMVGLFMAGMPLSGLLGAPISTFLLGVTDGWAGLQGWQWMFILEGLPAILLGFLCFRILPSGPGDAAWLAPDERAWLQNAVDEERHASERVRKYTVMQGLTNPSVLLLAVILFLVSSALYGSIFWIPQLVKGFGLSNGAVGIVAAIPYFVAVVAMILWTRHSDATRERVFHVVIPQFLAAAGFFIAGYWLHVPVVAVIGLSLACAGIYASFPVFWTLPTAFLTGPAAAGAIALITAVGNFSGIVTPALIGWSKDVTGTFTAAMAGLGIVLLIAGLLTLSLRERGRPKLSVAEA